MKKFPLYKTFSTINHYYVYDTNRNKIVSINRQSYDSLRKAEIDHTPLENLSVHSDEIRLLQENEYLSTNRPTEIEHTYH